MSVTMVEHEHEQELANWASQFIGQCLMEWQKQINTDYQTLRRPS